MSRSRACWAPAPTRFAAGRTRRSRSSTGHPTGSSPRTPSERAWRRWRAPLGPELRRRPPLPLRAEGAGRGCSGWPSARWPSPRSSSWWSRAVAAVAGATRQSTTSGAQEDVVPIRLTPVGGSRATGRISVVRVADQPAVDLAIAGLEPSGRGESYVLWFVGSGGRSLPVAFHAVGADGRLTGRTPIPTAAEGLLPSFTSADAHPDAPARGGRRPSSRRRRTTPCRRWWARP